MTAICTFALDLFETEEVASDAEYMEPFYIGTASMVELLPYLGNEKYPDLLAMTRKYHNAAGNSKKVSDSGTSEAEQSTHLANQTIDSANNISATALEAAKADKITASLGHLNDPIVIELFIRIINLIEYFSRQAVQNKTNNLFQAISSTLNDNEREACLFNCLAVPDDDVKLSVVKCLFVVPVDDFSYGEIE